MYKKIVGMLITMMMMYIFSFSSFAESREIVIDGESVVIETIGNVELIDPVDIPETRSVSSFSFNINDYTDTEAIENSHAKWQVQTQAVLRDYRTGVTNSDGSCEYTVSVMRGLKAIASYVGKTDNIKGGLTFSNMPTNVDLYIRIKAGRHPAYEFVYGTGETQFFN